MAKANRLEYVELRKTTSRVPHPALIGGALLLMIGITMLVTLLGVTIKSPPAVPEPAN
jgi:hypothetical protein